MCYTGLFKRIIPFVVTFAAGLFIASFFVSITPNFSWPESRRGHRRWEVQQLRNQVDELRRDREALKVENEELRRQLSDQLIEPPIPDGIPTFDFEAHHPPPPPRRPKQPRD